MGVGKVWGRRKALLAVDRKKDFTMGHKYCLVRGRISATATGASVINVIDS